MPLNLETIKAVEESCEALLTLCGYTAADVRAAATNLLKYHPEDLPTNEDKIRKELKDFKKHFRTLKLSTSAPVDPQHWNDPNAPVPPNYQNFVTALKDNKTPLTFSTFYTTLEPIITSIHKAAEDDIKNGYTLIYNFAAVALKYVARVATNDPDPNSKFKILKNKLQKFCLTANAASDKLTQQIKSCTSLEQLDRTRKNIDDLSKTLNTLLQPLRSSVLGYIESKQEQAVDALKRLLKDSALDIDTNKLKSGGFISNMPNVLTLFRVLSSIAGVSSKTGKTKHGIFGYGVLAKTCQDCIESLKKDVENQNELIKKAKLESGDRHTPTPSGYNPDITKSSFQ
ncbi:MAG: hypothetical protein IKE05_03015 [Clostridia bacterium]|nr:hypothetical protein [Clostridia bacterium]